MSISREKFVLDRVKNLVDVYIADNSIKIDQVKLKDCINKWESEYETFIQMFPSQGEVI